MAEPLQTGARTLVINILNYFINIFIITVVVFFCYREKRCRGDDRAICLSDRPRKSK